MTHEPPTPTPSAGRRLSRRHLLGAAGAGAAVGAVAGLGVARAAAAAPVAPAAAYDFLGAHQAGIVTPAQDRLYFAAFDVTTSSREEVVRLLRAWTVAAHQLTRGRELGTGTPVPYDAPPVDTGEATGLPAAGLTLTFGFGPTLFRTVDGVDRFGIDAHRPTALEELPHFPADDLDPARSGGDLCVQACADDPQVAVHAVRNLSRLAFGTAALRWSQLGFGRTSSTSSAQQTPRNLFGFKDGTANITAEQTADLDTHVWVAAGDDPGADWLSGGSYLVARRITMHLEPWDRTSLREQEAIVGRDRAEGAPLSGGGEFTEPDFSLSGRAGLPLVPRNSHVHLAHPAQNDGVRILRRGYNYTDGNDDLGRLDAGLFFLAYLRNPVTQYVPMQTRLSRDDAMMEYLQHTGSALFAIPPGVRTPDEWIGQTLLG